MTRQGENTKTKAHYFFPLWFRQRELRQRLSLGHSDALYKSLYSSISPCYSWGVGETSRNEHRNGLLSLEFSSDGTHLLAGSLNRFLMFDPLSRRLIRSVQDGHTGYVTHFKFLNSRIFATGGDDGNVFLWDTRNLKSRFQTLLGHSDSITNIEFSQNNQLLISSTFEGIIYLWDMKNWNQRAELNKTTLMSDVLLSLRLNPDETKMLISTASGYFFIVHQLDLNTLVQDLVKSRLGKSGFSYMDQTVFTSPQNWSSFLSCNHRRNRVERVTDFPNARDCNAITALEIHPEGWSAFSRTKNERSKKEWTCVHDIQERDPFECGTPLREGSGVRGLPCPLQLERINEGRRSGRGERGNTGRASVGSTKDSGSNLQDCALHFGMGVREGRSDSPAGSAGWSPTPGPSSAPPHFPELAGLGRKPAASRVVDHYLPRLNPNFAHFNRRVHVRCPRLTHFIDESYSSDWYIDSVGVSADGRLVSSPLHRGIRLLAFSPECSDQPVFRCGIKPSRLHEFSSHTCHSDIVICTKFSPRHCLVVSGCAGGTLSWYQPVV